MRLGLAIAAPLAIILSLPLFTTIVLNISFELYVYEVTQAAQNPHMQDAIQSIRDVSFASLCILPWFYVVPIFCASPDQALAGRATLSSHSLVLFQYTLFDQLVRHVPTPAMISTVSSLSDAADAAMAIITDELPPLLEEYGQGIDGIGDSDVQTLSVIGELSRALSHALFRILIHLELGVCRAVYTYDIVLHTLRTLDRRALEQRARTREWTALYNVMEISSHAMENSVEHIRLEVDYALSTATTLLTVLEKALPARGRLEHHCLEHDCLENDCGKPGVVHLCAQLVTLFQCKADLNMVITELHFLQDTMELRQDDFNFAIDNSLGSTSHLVTFTITVHHKLLAARLKAVQTARIAGGQAIAE